MKLAVVALPNEMKCEVVPREGQATPQIVFIGRTKQVAVLADNVPVGGTLPAQDALDRILAALAACGCR